MPPKAKHTKEEMIEKALEIVKKEGASGLTARRLAKELNSSVCTIFTHFTSMEEVEKAVICAANEYYGRYIAESMQKNVVPPYKASGLAYIRFAKEEKELFKLLFMRNREGERVEENREEIRPLLQILQSQLGISEDDAYLFHLEMWVYVHGLATMSVTSYLDWDMDFISRTLTDVYQGLKGRFTGRKDGN